MKHRLLTALIFLGAFSTNAQSFFTDHPLDFNPSMAGSANTSRLNFMGFVSAPSKATMSFDSYVGALRGGIGIIASTSVFEKSGVFIYSPKFTARKKFTIAPSFGAGLVSQNFTPHGQLTGGLLVNTKKTLFGASIVHHRSTSPYSKSKIQFSHKIELNNAFSLSGVYQSSVVSSPLSPIEYPIYLCGNEPLSGYVGSNTRKYKVVDHQISFRLKYHNWKIGVGVGQSATKYREFNEKPWVGEAYIVAQVTAGYESEKIGIHLMRTKQPQYRYMYFSPNGNQNGYRISLIYKFPKKL